ncbi:ethanolamine ammonia-lyase [Pseudomonas sp. Fl4BN1]|uniref:ethanolamine ammonia-lyase n=1 Tax=Pseudomonas sp. Fl4BN1 TaxID=2697651 RepID=UPI0013784143|nr:ethanolamine ammonia-lyase [Pseudomonas sp. Fl4BN1]NBF09338.1 ethanolamine ammonia-lyase subunit EutB [Pseudomonas sp. Fl4BN1]
MSLTPLPQIRLPATTGERPYSTRVLDREITFASLKAVLGAADISKAGDRVAGLAAVDEITREGARKVLSELTLAHYFEHPLTDRHGQIDSVMQVNYDIDHEVFREIAELPLGGLKDRLLRSHGTEIRRIGTALTGVMVAALAKLLDVHELILLSKKLKSGAAAKARTLVGLPGTLSSRLQPNHPTDNLSGITLLVYTGLSMGSGDALIGLNPAIDTVDNISATLRHLDKLRRETGAPTQICVLSHIKTQLACLDQGAPVEIMFQSLAGTERTLTDEFDVTVQLLDLAWQAMAERGPLRDVAENFMYFETGQGSELTYGKHEGIDMTTCEALCYGLARRYRPYMVNNVTGFIGPETHLDNFEMTYSCLQDQFMGKLLGLPMGMAPCYTLHSQVTLEGQQMATELLTAAGANFFMDVYLSTDRMLAYFDTSAHDNQTLREVHDLAPAPEYLRWALGKGIFQEDAHGNVERGPNWGNPRIFCESEIDFQRLLESTPATYGFDNAGPRPANSVSRTVRANLAVAREAIYVDLRPTEIGAIPLRELRTAAPDKLAHLQDPELGARLTEEVLRHLQPEYNDVQIVISDGLSAEAIHHNIPELLPVLLDGLRSRELRIGQPILAPYGRVKLAESVGEALQPQLIIVLIGERPGGDALASRSMSAYLGYRLPDDKARQAAAQFSGNPQIRYEYTVISNIYSGGLPPLEGGSVVAEKAFAILHHRAAGNRLENLLKKVAS